MPATFKMSDQGWAYIFVVTGCSMVIVCHHFSISADIGAGLIGAGINAFTSTEKQLNVARANTVNQVNEVPTEKKEAIA